MIYECCSQQFCNLEKIEITTLAFELILEINNLNSPSPKVNSERDKRIHSIQLIAESW